MNPPPLPDLIETENRGDDSSLIAHEDAPSISSDTFPDGAVLQEFVNRHRAMLGVLLTPPVGSISPDVRKAQDYVDGLVREMGPLAVHETQGWQRLLVNIYSSDSPNGFVRKLEGYSAEQSQALLDHFDPDGGGRPVYEVGVTVGLLRSVGSEEELRHVLAHELAHFTEGHIDRIGSSLGSQTHEAVADWVAFETVAEKGKNPIAGLNALEQIHRTSGVQEQQTVLEDALSAGGGTHHAEGVRVALAQIKIRQIELAHPHLLALELTPIPDFLRMSVNPRHTNPEAREQELSRGSEFAERCLQSACSGVTADIAIGPIGSAQISEVLHDGLQIITRCESASNSEKLDAVVGFVQLLVESQKSCTLTITPDARWELTRTMAGLLREGGSFEKVLEQIKRPINSSSSDRWETLFEPTILRSLEPLVPRHPEVVALYRELPGKVAEVKGKPARDLGETIRLTNAIDRCSEAAHPKISELLCEGGIDALRSCLNAREGLPSEGLYALSLLSKVSELSPFGESVHSEILAYASRNRETLLKGLEEALANTDDFDRMWRINRDLLALSRLVPHQPLNPTEEQRLGNAFLDYFRQVSLGIDLQDTGTITVALGEAPQLLRFLTGLADSSQADTNHRNAIRKCVFSNLPSTKLPRRGASSDAVNELATLIQATLTQEELLCLMMSQPRTQASSHGHLDREAQFHSLVTPLALVSRDEVASRQLAQEFNFQETKDLIAEIGARIDGVYTTIEKAPDRRGNRAGASIPLKLSGEAPRFILDCLNTNQHQAPNLDTWHETVSSLLRLAPNCLQGRPAHREALESHLLEQLEKIEDKSLEEWLRKPHISEILSAKEFAGQLVRLVLSPDGAAVQSDGQYHSWGLSNRLSQIEYSFQLEE